MEMDEEDFPPSTDTSLILPKDYVPPPTSISTLDPRLQVKYSIKLLFFTF